MDVSRETGWRRPPARRKRTPPRAWSTGRPAPVAAPVVRMEGVTKRYRQPRSLPARLLSRFRGDDLPAVEDISFEVLRGEAFGLLGPDGAGKTTLLEILATRVAPDRGQVTILGHDVVRKPEPIRRMLATVRPRERRPDPEDASREQLTVAETLDQIEGVNGRRRGSAIFRESEEALELAGLADHADTRVGELRPEERLRLRLARALRFRPHVLLLDEPTRLLDPAEARSFRDVLRGEILGRIECTVILATRDLEEALETCDRVAVLRRGRICAVGTPGQLEVAARTERYRIWVRGLEDPVLRWLEREAPTRGTRGPVVGSDGWTRLEMEAERGLEGAARLLARFTNSGATVARFEQVRPPLGEWMERVAGRQG